jgi:hypothetical protein
VDTLALFYQHRDFHRDQVPVVAGLQQRVSELELELELARIQSLESEVARLNKLLVERELELAKHDGSIAEAELRREVTEETSRELAAELDVRTREMFVLKTHTDSVKARYLATSCSNIVLRANLSAVAAQKRVAEAAQQATEEKLQEAESGLQASQTDLQKAKSKFHELRKKSKHYKSKATQYKAKVDRFHSQILAFTKVRDQTWVNGFSWGFNSLKEFALNPSTPSPKFAELNYIDFMDVPEQAILELRGIGRDLIPDVPNWVDKDAEPVDGTTQPADSSAPTEVVNVEAFADQDFGEPNTEKP